MIVKVMMSPSPMALFYLLQLLTLFVSEIDSHLAMRIRKNSANPSTGISPNISQLCTCFIDDRRNFFQLFWSQIEFSAKPFFHSSADPFRMMQFKEMIPDI